MSPVCCHVQAPFVDVKVPLFNIFVLGDLFSHPPQGPFSLQYNSTPPCTSTSEQTAERLAVPSLENTNVIQGSSREDICVLQGGGGQTLFFFFFTFVQVLEGP